MNVKNKKRILASALGISKKRVILNPERLDEVKKAITKNDLRHLVKEGAIAILNKKGVSKGRSAANKVQKKKGRQSGHGSRKGKATARRESRLTWINSIRLQRAYLQGLRQKGYIENDSFRMLYRKAGGGVFRSKRHIRLYLEENQLLKTIAKESKTE